MTVAYVRNLCDGMEEKEHEGKISLFEPLHDFYRENVSQQYREDGEPGCTTEPEIPAELLTQAAAMCDTAIISICRYSAEGGDRKETDFYLSSEEQRMVTDVMALFRKVVVVLNVGGALDVHTGHGVHTGRQEAPHTHFIAPSPDRRFLLSTDLGLDSIFVYDEGLNVRSIAHVPAGQGVRHLAYADDGMTVFAANELGSTVSMFTYHDGQLTLRQTIPVLFHEYENMPAAIRVRGEYVYVSNRGDDSISCLHWDQSGMELCSVTPCSGCWPRDFEIIENTIFCTNVLSAVPYYIERLQILKNAKSVLKDSGVLFISTQYRNSYFNTYNERADIQRFIDGWLIPRTNKKYCFYAPITENALSELCVDAWLQIKKVFKHDGSCFIIAAKPVDGVQW